MLQLGIAVYDQLMEPISFYLNERVFCTTKEGNRSEDGLTMPHRDKNLDDLCDKIFHDAGFVGVNLYRKPVD